MCLKMNSFLVFLFYVSTLNWPIRRRCYQIDNFANSQKSTPIGTFVVSHFKERQWLINAQLGCVLWKVENKHSSKHISANALEILQSCTELLIWRFPTVCISVFLITSVFSFIWTRRDGYSLWFLCGPWLHVDIILSQHIRSVALSF